MKRKYKIRKKLIGLRLVYVPMYRKFLLWHYVPCDGQDRCFMPSYDDALRAIKYFDNNPDKEFVLDIQDIPVKF